MPDGEQRPFVPELDTNRPNVARLYDLLLGGKNNFEPDRQLLQQVLKIAPEVPELAKENRRWLAKVVDRMVREGGVSQFLDLGAGLPTAENTHEVAQRADPAATVVYVDNDPIAIAHGEALLVDEKQTYFAAGDLTDADSVLADPVVKNALDLNRPVGLMLGMVLNHVPDTALARDFIGTYMAALPSGSYLAISHPSNPRDGSRLAEFSSAVEDKLKVAFDDLYFRTADEIAGLFDGLEILEPGLVGLNEWWPPGEHLATPNGASRLLLAGLARKP